MGATPDSVAARDGAARFVAPLLRAGRSTAGLNALCCDPGARLPEADTLSGLATAMGGLDGRALAAPFAAADVRLSHARFSASSA